MTHSLTSSLRQGALVAAGALAIGLPAFGQGFNVDFGANAAFPVPSSSYPGAAAQPGTWNAVGAAVAGAPLLDLSGAASGVTISESGAFGTFEFNNASTTGDDQNLYDDLLDIGGTGGASTVTISGLTNGNYEVFTYSWAPDNRTGFCTNVDVAGSGSGSQTICGTWPGGHGLGITFAQHSVSVSAGTITINLATNTGFGSINGVQVRPDAGGPTSYCDPPNANSVSPGGAILSSTGGYGTANATFLITNTPVQPGILFSGPNQIDVPFGCGRRCVGGNIVRGPVEMPSSTTHNATFDMSAIPNNAIQWWYRDPANFANCGFAFNLSNALAP